MTSPRLIAASKSTRTEAQVRALRSGAQPATIGTWLRAHGTPLEWALDTIGAFALIITLCGLVLFASLMTNTPDRMRPIQHTAD